MARADKKSFIVYHDWEDAFLALDTDEERAQLCMAMFSYAIRREIPEDLSPKLRFGFQFIKRCMDRDFEKYETICRENAARGALGGEAKKRNSLANASERMRTLTNVADKDKGKGKEKGKAKGKDRANRADGPSPVGDVFANILPSLKKPYSIESLREEYGNELVNDSIEALGEDVSPDDLEAHIIEISQAYYQNER